MSKISDFKLPKRKELDMDASQVQIPIAYMVVFANSAYECVRDQDFNRGHITKFLLRDNTEQSVDSAVQKIQELLQNHPALCPTFDTQNMETLRLQIKQKKYLTINVNAVCLSEELEAPGNASPTYVDSLFSQTLLKEPVRCAAGHYLEKASAEYWLRRSQQCPGGDHLLGDPNANLTVDREHQDYIIRFKRQHEQERQNLDMQLSRNLALNSLLLAKGGVKTSDVMHLVGGTGKLLGKIATKDAALILNKLALNLDKKLVSATALKYIPFFSVIAGITFAVLRWQNGEHGYKVAGEVASGFAPLIPTVGIAIAAGIDICIGAHDIYQFCSIQITPEGTYQMLGLSREDPNLTQNEVESHYCYTAAAILGLPDDPIPSKREVQERYRQLASAIHPDTTQAQLNPIYKDNFDIMMRILNKARDDIFMERQWT